MIKDTDIGIVVLYRGGECELTLKQILRQLIYINNTIHLIIKNTTANPISNLQFDQKKSIILHRLPDDGLDWGAYIRIAKIVNEKYLLFINSNTQLIVPDVDKILKFHLEKCTNPNRSICGASGSYEVIKPDLKSLASQKMSIVAKFLYLYRYIKTRNVKMKSVCFPNPHIRSNVFMANRFFFLEYCNLYNFPESKFDCYELENGRDSFSAYALKTGGDIKVVNKTNESFSNTTMHKAAAFRSVSINKSIAYDNQHREFQSSSWLIKIILMKYAWG